MLIKASTVYRDMINFSRNQFDSIMLLTLLTTLVSVVIGYSLSPSGEQLMTLSNGIYTNDTVSMNLQQLVQQMSIEQRHVLLRASFASTLSGLVGNVLLSGGLLTMIRLISNRQSVSMLDVLRLSTPLLPRLLLLIFLTTLLVQIGLLIIIIPGILIAITFSLSPIIAICDNFSAIKSMRLSAILSFDNFRTLAPAVILWLVAKAIVLLLVTPFTLTSSLIAIVLSNILSNFFSALLLIYLYRLYMLLKHR